MKKNLFLASIVCIVSLSCKNEIKDNLKSSDLKTNKDSITTKDTLFGKFYYGMKTYEIDTENNKYYFVKNADSLLFDVYFIFNKNSELDSLYLYRNDKKISDNDLSFILNLYQEKYGNFKYHTEKINEITSKEFSVKRIYWNEENPSNYIVNKSEIHNHKNPFLALLDNCGIIPENEFEYHIGATNKKTGDKGFFKVSLSLDHTTQSEYLLKNYSLSTKGKSIDIISRKLISNSQKSNKSDFVEETNPIEEYIKIIYTKNKKLNTKEQKKVIDKSDI